MALAALALAGPAPEPATADAPPPPRLLVTAEEWRLTPSRTVIDPGDAIVQLYNDGEDAHDLWIRRVDGVRTFKSPETLPGEVSEFMARLRAGHRYRLWCSLPGHRELGMHTRLRVNDR